MCALCSKLRPHRVNGLYRRVDRLFSSTKFNVFMALVVRSRALRARRCSSRARRCSSLAALAVLMGRGTQTCAHLVLAAFEPPSYLDALGA